MSGDRLQALRKGWCPGALRPMMALDGLLVRLRLTGGILSAADAESLADLAERHGSGRFDLTARANLQMRGVRTADLPSLLGALRARGLVDEGPQAEAVRNVIASPLAGLDGGLDIRPLVGALEARLIADETLHALPGKFGFLADDGGNPTLAAVPADVRFDWDAGAGCFSVALGGTRASAAAIGPCSTGDLVERAAIIAGVFLEQAAKHASVRRMHGLRAAIGDVTLARACGGRLRTATQNNGHDRTAGSRAAVRPQILSLAAPFGRLDAGMLRAAATIACDGGSGELRLTPWRSILVPVVDGSLPTFAARGNASGFISGDSDPRLKVAACTGQDGCARGTTPTHGDAAALADVAAALGDGVTLHVSGCEKGCAKPSPTAATLVGRAGRYDFVRDGLASDAPVARGLDLASCREVLRMREVPA